MKSKINEVEHATIDHCQQDRFNNSRLACAIKLKPYMNEMIVSQVRQEDFRDSRYVFVDTYGKPGEEKKDEFFRRGISH